MDDYVTHWKVEDLLRFRLFLTHEKIIFFDSAYSKAVSAPDRDIYINHLESVIKGSSNFEKVKIKARILNF